MSMQFRSPRPSDEPELNLIAFIDILLVVLIFLVLTTSYNQLAELRINLPVADAPQPRDRPRELTVAIGRDSQIAVQGSLLPDAGIHTLSQALAEAARDGGDTVLVIAADAAAPHQAVVTVMDAARRTGLSRITFSTQPEPSTPAAPGAAPRPAPSR